MAEPKFGYLLVETPDATFSALASTLVVPDGSAVVSEDNAVEISFVADSGTVFTFDATNLWDNGYWVAESGYNRHSPLARAVFETTATSVDVDVYANFTPGAGTAIQIWVNGFLYITDDLAASSGAQTMTFSLPAGKKNVWIVSGAQGMSGSTILGVFLVGCEFNAAATMLPPEAPARLVVYGDSTSMGGGGGSTGANVDTAWPTQFRKLSTRSILPEAISGRTLEDDAVDATARGIFVDRLVAMNPASLLFLIGTNDYNANAWSAASFGTAYAATIDDLHTELPNIKIYCMTPLYKAQEPANGSGNKLDDYREQIRTIARARWPWAVLLEGAALLSEAEMLSESSVYIHPNDLGNRRIAEFVDKVLSGVDWTMPLADPYGLTEDVVWTNGVNVAITGNSIQKNGGVDFAADAGAGSTKAISNGGIWWVEFTITETNKNRVFGVGSNNTGVNLNDIRWGFNCLTDGTIAAWHSGAGYNTGLPTYAAGDRYVVRSDGSSVYYERIRAGIITNLRKDSISVAQGNYPLYVKANMLGSNSTITNAKIHGILQ